jgi:3',5'-nucleoside bisphosphate phosphatase
VKFADLHLHTVYSDGTYTPAELVSEAGRAGLSTIAVVDHDTVEGILPVLQAAGSSLEVLPGIELSSEYDNLEVHILGYLMDYENKAFIEKLDILKKNRVERIYKMTDKLKELGLKLDPETVFDIAGNGTVGRLHVARAMLKEKLIGNIFEAFEKYIGDRGPAFVLNFKFSTSEAIGLIKEAGGIPVLAHPYIIRNDDVIADLIRQGVMGLEAHYPEHTQSMINYYLDLAKKNGLLVTGGSDCHGSAKPEAKMGSIKLPYELVEKLKAAQRRL